MTCPIGKYIYDCAVSMTGDLILLITRCKTSYQFDLRMRSGKHLSTIVFDEACKVSWTLTAENDIAVACNHTLGLLKFKGGLGSTCCPDVEKCPVAVPCQSMVHTDPAGTKLAFSTGCASGMHLYDAVTLVGLGCVNFEGNAIADVAVMWAPFGWLHMIAAGPSLSVRVFGPQLHSSLEREVLLLDRQHIQLPALSPDGALLGVFEASPRAAIKVFDTRSGRLMLMHALELAGAVIDTEKQMSLTWSLCGAQLMVTAYAKLDDKPATRVYVLQF